MFRNKSIVNIDETLEKNEEEHYDIALNYRNIEYSFMISSLQEGKKIVFTKPMRRSSLDAFASPNFYPHLSLSNFLPHHLPYSSLISHV